MASKYAWTAQPAIRGFFAPAPAHDHEFTRSSMMLSGISLCFKYLNRTRYRAASLSSSLR